MFVTGAVAAKASIRVGSTSSPVQQQQSSVILLLPSLTFVSFCCATSQTLSDAWHVALTIWDYETRSQEGFLFLFLLIEENTVSTRIIQSSEIAITSRRIQVVQTLSKAFEPVNVLKTYVMHEWEIEMFR